MKAIASPVHRFSAPRSILASLGLFAASILAPAVSATAAPILYYDFDTPGAVQTSSGTVALSLTTNTGTGTSVDRVTDTPPGPDGSSVLGFADAAANTRLGGAPYATINTLSTEDKAYFQSDLGSFTITAWVQDVTRNGNIGRLFHLRDGSGNVAIDFGIGGTTNALRLAVNGSSALQSTLLVPEQSDVWQFIAVTFDATDGTVTFYSGPSTSETLASQAHGTKLTNPQVTTSTLLTIGSSSDGARLLNGNIDNFAFYNSALNSSELNAIFAAIPEPGTLGLLGLGVAFAGAGFLRSKRRSA